MLGDMHKLQGHIMMQDANRHKDGIFVFLTFSDQNSYIKHFYLVYQLKVINILVLLLFKIENRFILLG
jgi:hypothetical protein